MKIATCSFPEALEILKDHSGKKRQHPLKPKGVSVTTQASQSKVSNLSDQKIYEIYEKFFNLLELTDVGRIYLTKRGVKNDTITRFNLSNAAHAGSLRKELLGRYSEHELIMSGLLNNAGKFVFWKPAIIFPFYKSNQIIYLASSNYDDQNKSFKLASIEEKYYDCNLDNNEIIVFEGIFDALSYYQIEKKDNFIALNGGFTFDKIRNIEEYCKGDIICCFDNDVPGALSRLQIEKRKTIKTMEWKGLSGVDKDIYEMISQNFSSYGEARECLAINKEVELDKYKSNIKDYNGLLLMNNSESESQ